MTDSWLAGPVTSTAYGWRLERRDGVTLGFTSHDHDIVHDGLLLRSNPGMRPTSIVESAGLEIDGLEVNGALSSNAINCDDLMSARWDAAYLEIFLFDWNEPSADRRLLASGELGAVSFSGASFEAEFLGLTGQLDRPVVPQTSPSCRATFCDADCGLNRARFTHRRVVDDIQDSGVHLNEALPVAADGFKYGSLRWLSGENSGLVSNIAASATDSVTLAGNPAFPVVPGTRIELMAGCDKQLTTCATRFGNAVNFRGEPYLPGNDLLTRYPGG